MLDADFHRFSQIPPLFIGRWFHPRKFVKIRVQSLNNYRICSSSNWQNYQYQDRRRRHRLLPSFRTILDHRRLWRFGIQ